MRLIWIIICLLVAPQLWGAGSDSLLKKLDMAIEMRPTYGATKRQTLHALQQNLQRLRRDDISGRMSLNESLWQAYRSFNTDSALHYANALYRLAQQAGDEEQLFSATLHCVNALMIIGMFKEAYELLAPLSEHPIPQGQRVQYLHLSQTLYGLMADYAVTPKDKQTYTTLAATFRDSLLHVYEPSSTMYHMLYADELMSRGGRSRRLGAVTPLPPQW